MCAPRLRPAFARACVLTLALALFSPTAPAHHGGEQFYAGPEVPSADTPTTSYSGRVTELVVEDRVLGMSIRYVGLVTDEGRRLRLKRGEPAALLPGTRIEAAGQLEGSTLFVSGIRVLALQGSSAAAAKASRTVEGRYTLIHADDFDTGRSHYEHAVFGDDGSTTPVDFAVMPDVLANGMRVAISGATALDGQTLEAERLTILALPPARSSAQTDTTIAATANTIAILIKFADTTTEPFTQAAAQTAILGGPGTPSVAEFYREASYGRQLLAGTVTPWLRATINKPTTCNYSGIGAAADAAATAGGYNLGAYSHRIYIFPRVSACGWSGLAYVGVGRAYINQSLSLLVLGHELGHNFGELHAASLDCGVAVIGGTCTSSEYGDEWNIMGNRRAMHFNAFQKLDLGWIASSTVPTHAGGVATYSISPIEAAGGATYAVRIPARTDRTYWLEYRQPVGFDGALATYPNNGVQLRVSGPFESICSGCADDTELLDATPSTSPQNDGTLVAGKAYADWDTGVTISVLSASASGVQVQVARGAARKRLDVNRDLKTDLLWRNAVTGATSLWTMNGTALVSGTTLLGDPNWRVTHFGDFDGDRRADLVWRNGLTGATAIWLMNGAQYASGATVLTNPQWRVTHVADFNGDGKADLVWRNDTTGATSMWLMNGVSLASGATLLTDPNWRMALTGDFDGDGRTDLLWHNSVTGAGALWLMNGTQLASGAVVLTTPGWVPQHAQDFDGDGRADLVWRNPVTGATAMWLMNGLQRSSGAVLLIDSAWNASHAADLDGDGRADLVWRNATTGVTAIWSMSGTATLASTAINADADWSVAGVADANGDSKADLLWRNAATGATAMWLMNGAATLSGATLMANPDWSVVAVD